MLYTRKHLIGLAKGAITFLPGKPGLGRVYRARGGQIEDEAGYNYSVWLKHLAFLTRSGAEPVIPETMAELGPGDSIGVGIAALLSGVERYYALDVQRYTNVEQNLAMLDNLVELFRSRKPCPSKGWPDFGFVLDEDGFPSSILTDERLERALEPKRIADIRTNIEQLDRASGPYIEYHVPWTESGIIREETVDLILSHSVLEHIVDLETTYDACRRWLKPGGWMSHQIDFSSHNKSEYWNGQWSFSDPLWKIFVGRRPFLINREPQSVHVALHEKFGFELRCNLTSESPDGIDRSQLAGRWRDLDDDDLGCSASFVQSQKIA